jgi:ParB/RepB/Spo0J family partition protein
MAALKDLAKSRGTLMNFDPRKLKVKKGLNSRDATAADNLEHIQWLAKSIAEEGVKTPLVVFQDGDDVYVADGHCRLAAVLLAIEQGVEIETIPCIPEPRGTNGVDRVLSQVIYNSGKKLTPLELGANFKKALALGGTVEVIAKRVNMSPSWVNQMVDLQAAPTEVHEMVKKGKVSATLAAKVVRRDGVDGGAETLKKVSETKGDAKVTEKDIAPKDVTWGRVVKWVRKCGVNRPKGVTDKDLYKALELIGEP